jgi:AbrB family looped-hinge helix DNA binding protein
MEGDMTTDDVQFSKTARLGSGGRIVVPAELRQRMGWKQDDALRFRVVDGHVEIESVMEGIRRAQRIFAEHDQGGGSLVDELIADRRAENAKDVAENTEFDVTRIEEALKEWQAR